jgi:hypothetical protein
LNHSKYKISVNGLVRNFNQWEKLQVNQWHGPIILVKCSAESDAPVHQAAGPRQNQAAPMGCGDQRDALVVRREQGERV